MGRTAGTTQGGPGNGNGNPGNEQENDAAEDLMSALGGQSGSFLVYKHQDTGRAPFKGTLHFDPGAKHPHGAEAAFLNAVRSKWGAGSYRVKRAQTGGGFAKGPSVTIDVDDEGEVQRPGVALVSANPQDTVLNLLARVLSNQQTTQAPAQGGFDVNPLFLKLLEVLGKGNGAGLGAAEVKDILVAAQSSWGNLASKFDSGSNNLSQLRELIKLTRELVPEHDPTPQRSEMSEMMEMFKMMQGMGGPGMMGGPGWMMNPNAPGSPMMGMPQAMARMQQQQQQAPPPWAQALIKQNETLLARLAVLERGQPQRAPVPADSQPVSQDSAPPAPVPANGRPVFNLEGGWNMFGLPPEILQKMVDEATPEELIELEQMQASMAGMMMGAGK